jgi:hypothetical protein
MKLRQLQFEGFFEEQPSPTVQQLQVVEPENDLERQLLAWSILCRSQTVEEDLALRDYAFYYELGDHLGEGRHGPTMTASAEAIWAAWPSLSSARQL